MDLFKRVEQLLENILNRLNKPYINGDLEYFFNNQSIEANSIEIISDAIFTGDCLKIWIWCSQTLSDNFEIYVYSESTPISSDKCVIYPINLDLVTKSTSLYITECPPYIKIGILNKSSNTTNVTIKMITTR